MNITGIPDRKNIQSRILAAAAALMTAAMVFSTGAYAAEMGDNATSMTRPMKLSVADAVNMAMAGNPMLAASKGDSSAAAARVKMAVSQRRPSLSATTFLSDGDMSGILSGPPSVMPVAQNAYAAQGYSDQNFSLMMPLDISGKLSRNVRGASKRATASAMDAEITRQDVAFETRMQYYDVLYMEQMVDVYQKALDVANEQLKIDAAAVEAGKEPAFYLDRDRAEVSMAGQRLAEALRDAIKARILLLSMMGMDPETNIELTDALAAPDEKSAPTELPRDTPDIAAYRERAGAAKADLDSSRRAFAPDVAIALMSDSLSSEMGPMEGTTAALIVAVPLGDGGMRRATVRESAGMLDAAREELRAREIKLKSDFHCARVDFETAMNNIATSESAVKSAGENYRVAKIRYEAGKGILVEILDALTMLTDARASRAKALRDALVARDALIRISGKL